MKIISTNIADEQFISWRGKKVKTGIYKKSVDQPLYLTKQAVQNDEISDRKHHGGEFKACYIFSLEQYPYWKELYPDLEWDYGMFGENLTVSNFDENKVYLGDTYSAGEAVIQVSHYREPCYKLGYKFGSQQILKQYIKHGYPGTYLKVLQEGTVKTGDEFQLLERQNDPLSVTELFRLAFAEEKDHSHLEIAANNEALDPKKREYFSRFLVSK